MRVVSIGSMQQMFTVMTLECVRLIDFIASKRLWTDADGDDAETRIYILQYLQLQRRRL